MSLETMRIPENPFREEVVNLHNVVDEEQQNGEWVTIDDLTDKEKQQLESSNNDKKEEILELIKNITNNNLTEVQREGQISFLLSHFGANAKIDYNVGGKHIITSKIGNFFRKVKDGEISFENVTIFNTIMDNEHIKKKKVPGGYNYEQKINKISFSSFPDID